MQEEEYRLIALRARDSSIRAYTKVSVEDFDNLIQYRWWLHSNGYAARKSPQINRHAGSSILMHREILDLDSGRKIIADHINGDKLDNIRINLRKATVSENGQNKIKLSNLNKSGYRGVYWCKKEKKWVSCAVIKKKRHFLGHYNNAFDAGKAAAEFRAKHMPFSKDAMKINSQ